ncbi:MAG: SagB family peptide dehydrogenase [Desulfotignum sp.]|nr:SagB family peptide dehydrogenase [Desulfotignum sp.]MCF8138729.1 SagB family peptide dehydrogenase [Desulfotignum sp.]
MGQAISDPPVSAVRYHEHTSHVRHRISPHSLDFSRYPAPFKTYEYQDRISLKQGNGTCQGRNKDGAFNDLDATVGQVLGGQTSCDESVDLETVSRILGLSYGVTLADRSRGLMFRSVPSAGGLYPCQMYLSVRKIDDIETGLYYCDTVQGFLGRINPRPLDTEIFFPYQDPAGVCLVITGIFYHSAWKYRERAFRYLLLDAGHLAEAVVQAARAVGVRARIKYDFNDPCLIQGLNLNDSLEVPLACVSLGPGIAPGPESDLKPFHPAKSGPEPAGTVIYDILKEAYQAGISIAQSPAVDWDTQVFNRKPDRMQPVPDPGPFETLSFFYAVTHRRSRRNFSSLNLTEPMWAAFLNRVFTRIFSGLDPDETGASATGFLEMAMISQNMEGLTPGLYSFSWDGATLACRQTRVLAGDLARVCLDQAWISRAAMNFLIVADLAAMESALGARGYRYVMMHAGRVGQRLYMAAQELGLGCCGIGAMYDKEAVALLGLNPGSVLLYAVSAGPVK